MITHVVSLKLNKTDDFTILKNQFLDLKHQIKQIGSIKVEKNINHKRIENFDLICFITFDSLEDVQEYLDHPAHVKFKEVFIKPLSQKVMTLDY